MATPTITLIGLGPGDPMLLTRAAWEALHQADIIYTPVPEHPALAECTRTLRKLPPDPAQAAATLIEQARTGSIIYAAWQGVYPTSSALMKLHLAATQHNITLRLLPDVRDNLHPLPSSPAQATATRSWVETQSIQTYNAPLIPVDPLRELDSFDTLHYVITRLLGPGGCPWDVQQTHQSLRANLLEETYEVLETLDRSDMTALSEELGDLLMQVLVHSEMARQAGYFDIGDVLEQISSKLIRRHPHVFSDVPVADENEVLRNWEHIKAQERAHKGSEHRSALDGIPAGLPALAAAQKAGGRAARAGFDWPTLELIWGKVHEELAELIQAHEEHTAAQSDTSRAHLAEELGDTIYVVVQLARWLDLDAESVLREATSKFRRRFQAVEQAAREQDTSLHDLTLDQKLALWRAAKDQ